MECVLQWLDEVDDAVSMIAAQSETIRRILRGFSAACIGFLVLSAGAVVAMVQPLAVPLTASLLLALLLYRRLACAGTSDLGSAGQAAAHSRSR